MIREYRTGDLARLIEIAMKAWKPVFDEYINQLGEELYPLVIGDPEEPYRIKRREVIMQAMLARDEILICERENKVVGFLFFGMRGKTGIICNNARDPEYDGKGVGQELYSAVLQKFRDGGMTLATVSTGLDAGHASARRAYERAGFKHHQDKIVYYLKLK